MSRAAEFFGSNDLGRLFPDDAPATVTPWPRAGRRKDRQDYDKDRVKAVLEAPHEHPTTQVDPRELLSTQPFVTRAGVSHYMGAGKGLFSDRGNAGNQVPVVYRRDGQNMLLSGHHRAAAALLQGRQFDAKVIEGPWGPAR